MPPDTKRRVLFLVKLALTVVIAVMIYGKVIGRQNAGELRGYLGQIDARWLLPALAAQLAAVASGTLRWQQLLDGQGVHATYRHLFGSFMIGRFFGAVTPGGVGLQGYGVYDIATRTKKTARATATVGIATLTGMMGFAGTTLLGSVFGLEQIGLANVLLIDAGFLALITAATLLVSRPVLFRAGARAALGSVPTKVQTLVDSVCAYEGRGWLVARAFGLSMLVHIFNNLIYVCAAKALGFSPTAGEIFFVSSLQIFATLLPISINGVGVREAAAVGLYTTFFGVPATLALLVPVLGFAVEMCVSLFGGVILVARRHGYDPEIVVDDPEREELVHQQVAAADIELPGVGRAAVIGLGGGLLAGLLVGVGEGAVVLLSSSDVPDYGVLVYGAVAYGLLCAAAGLGGGFALAVLGRLIHRQAVAPAAAYGRWAGALTAAFALALGAFRVRRDVFHEELVWKSQQGLMVLLGCVIGAAVLYLFLSYALRLLAGTRAGRFLLLPYGTAVVAAVLVFGLFGWARANPVPGPAASGRELPAAPSQANHVLVIVVDTLRADRLPGYGYAAGSTPSLDAFAADAVRFDQAFSNASWTRPSFASIMTGRYPSSHAVMSKASALPDELTTMAEAFSAGGYYTTGFATNYNVAPFFNFGQGFDEYRYLEPNFVLGANDTDAKLLLVQVLKRVVERFSEAQPGDAYQDAETVNRELFTWLDRAPAGNPFLLFVGYMDPHDPYFPHPYGEPGYGRASHQSPDPSEAPRLSNLYDGEITYWDAHFGALVADLKARGLYDRMTIVVTSDHGEEFMEHGGFWHGTTLYDEQVRVPLYVKLPFNERGGSTVRHWVQSVDLLPTLLRQNGLPAVEGVQGGDLFEGTNEVYAEESHEGNILEALRTRRGNSEVKVITANPGNPRGLPEVELFRVDQDPGERVNLAGEQPAVASLATDRLGYWSDQARRGAVEGQQIQIGGDGASEDRLRALGYAGAEGEPAAPTPPSARAEDATGEGATAN